MSELSKRSDRGDYIPAQKLCDEPHAKRKGMLKNGNPSGDPSKAPRCGARTRNAQSCKAPAMTNGRCRMHGGKSTGPRTVAGLKKSQNARRKHGFYSARAKESRRRVHDLMKEANEFLGQYWKNRPD